MMKRLEKAKKAYDNSEFIHSPDGRTLRILAEYLYPEQYFRKHEVEHTIVFYGSARSTSIFEHNEKIVHLEKKIENLTGKDKIKYEKLLDDERNRVDIANSYMDAVNLATMLSKWSETLPQKNKFYICSGGGPGMMEAANLGAHNAGVKSIGLNISLPFEQFPNEYISPELNFEFHYFFMRKFWFSHLAQAMVAFPGGFGTLDELMDILTLIQTKKITRRIPIVLYYEEFWKNVINFDYLIDKMMISPDNMDLFVYKNTPEQAFNYIKQELTKIHELEK